MRIRSYISVLILSALVFSLACSSAVYHKARPTGQTRVEPAIQTKPVSDIQIRNRLQKELIGFQESGRAATSQTIATQLGRSNCGLDLAPPSGENLSRNEIYCQRKNSVVVVGTLYKCKKCTKWHTSTASGFFVSKDGAVVTNLHVVKKEEGYQALGVMTSDGEVYLVTKVLASDRRNDLVILQVDAGADAVFTPASLASDDAPAGTPVVLISHPSGHFYTLTSGIVSRHVLQRGRKRMEITADYAKGSSGAPVLDAAGNVTGIVRTTTSIYYTGDKNLQMVVKTCIPVSALKKMIDGG